MNIIAPAMSLHDQPNAPLPAILPDDLIAHILSLLAVKSLTRLRSVSKSWNVLISDPDFAKMHLNRFARDPHLILMSTSFYNVSSVHHNYVPISVRRLLKNQPTTITDDDPFYRGSDKNCYWWIVGSCNRLVCMLGDFYQDYWLCFWNPATKVRSKNLGFGSYPHTDPPMSKTNFAFGYDNSTDTYKVVSYFGLYYKDGDPQEPWRSEVRVFGSSDKIWRNIQSFPVTPLLYNSPLNAGVYISGTINWLALHNFRRNYDCKDITIEQFVIVSLDLSTETYTELVLPQGFNEVPGVEPTVGVLMDCLCFYHDFRRTDFVIWQMKEFGVQESWTQLLKFSYLQDLQMDYDICRVWRYPFLLLSPLCLSENGDTLILGTQTPIGHEAIIYNWKDNKVERIGIINRILWCWARHYIESLVSICSK